MSLTPNRTGANYEIGVGYLLKDDPERALEYFEKESDDEWNVKGRALGHYELGNDAEFQALLQELIDGWGERWPSEVAHVYSWTGDPDQAFAWLDKAIEISEAGVRTQFMSPMYRNVTDDARWEVFRERSHSSASLLDAIELPLTSATCPD